MAEAEQEPTEPVQCRIAGCSVLCCFLLLVSTPRYCYSYSTRWVSGFQPFQASGRERSGIPLPTHGGGRPRAVRLLRHHSVGRSRNDAFCKVALQVIHTIMQNSFCKRNVPFSTQFHCIAFQEVMEKKIHLWSAAKGSGMPWRMPQPRNAMSFLDCLFHWMQGKGNAACGLLKKCKSILQK